MAAKPVVLGTGHRETRRPRFGPPGRNNIRTPAQAGAEQPHATPSRYLGSRLCGSTSGGSGWRRAGCPYGEDAGRGGAGPAVPRRGYVGGAPGGVAGAWFGVALRAKRCDRRVPSPAGDGGGRADDCLNREGSERRPACPDARRPTGSCRSAKHAEETDSFGRSFWFKHQQDSASVVLPCRSGGAGFIPQLGRCHGTVGYVPYMFSFVKDGSCVTKEIDLRHERRGRLQHLRMDDAFDDAGTIRDSSVSASCIVVMDRA